MEIILEEAVQVFCGQESQAPFILCSKALVLSLDKRLKRSVSST